MSLPLRGKMITSTEYSSIMLCVSSVFVQAVLSLFIYIVGNNPGKKKEIG